ncbi:MAG: VOC family protein [Candidatus Limnocylindria bacterium]
MANPITWFEIIGRDGIKLRDFYSNVFGWKMGPPAAEFGNYSTVEAEPTGIGGGIGEGGDQGGNRTTIYVEVDDLEAYLDKVTKAGGKTVMPVMNVMEGVTIAMFADPDGNVVGLLKSVPR